MPSENYSDVRRFHQKFDLVYEGQPRLLPEDLQAFRTAFLYEEVKEYEDAVADGDLAKAFDALLDIVYVALGTAYFHGFPWDRGWALVHESNMRKARPKKEDEKRSEWDVIKPEGWTPPDIHGLLGTKRERP